MISYAMRPDSLMRVFKKSMETDRVNEATQIDLMKIGQKMMADFPDYINAVNPGTDQYTGNIKVDLEQDFNATDTYLLWVNGKVEVRKAGGDSGEISMGFYDLYDYDGIKNAVGKLIGEY